MVQAAGLVNVVVKNQVGFTTSAGMTTLGDGATAADVFARDAADLAKVGALVSASDVKIRASDFSDFVLDQEDKDRA